MDNFIEYHSDIMQFWDNKNLIITKIKQLYPKFQFNDIDDNCAYSIYFDKIIEKCKLINTKDSKGKTSLYISLLELFSLETNHSILSQKIEAYLNGFDIISKRIAIELKRNQLILVLGQDFLDFNNVNPLKVLNKKIKTELSDSNIIFEEKYENILYYLAQKYAIKYTNFSTIHNHKSIIDWGEEIFKTSSKTFDKTLFEKLNNLPFKCIVNFNYDNFFEKFYPENYETIIVNSTKYDPEIEKKILDKKNSKRLVFNIFGGLFEEKNDLKYNSIVTEIRLVEFFEQINDNMYPNFITLKETHLTPFNTHFIFLGFNFNPWFVKLLLKMYFGVKKGINPIAIESTFNESKKIHKEFFEDDLEITFINTPDRLNLIDMIIEEYQKIK
jgi:hypothetical protein